MQAEINQGGDTFMSEISTKFNPCVACENTEFSPDANYCKKCGQILTNYCACKVESGCEHINPQDALFCEQCGGFTTRLELLAALAHISSEEYASSLNDY